MKTSHQLKQERAVKREAFKTLIDKIKGEKREATEQENTELDTLTSELEALDNNIGLAEKREAQESRIAASQGLPVDTTTSNAGEERDLSKYSFTKFLRESTLKKGELTGLELEMHQEAEKEVRSIGEGLKGWGIPEKILWQGSKRDNTVTAGTQPADGAVLVETQLMSFIDILRNKLVTERLGATFMRGLQGNITIPKQLTEAVSTWKTEIAALDKSNITFGSVSLSPNRLGTYAVISKQLLIQSSVDVERLVRNSIAYSIAKAVDVAAINGSGSAPEPMGILNRSDVNTAPLGTNGAAPTRAMLIAMEAEIQYDDADMDNMKYLTNPRVLAKLKNTLLDAGSGRFVIEDTNEANNYPVVVSNLVPSNLSKGTGSNLSAAIFGYWPALMIGQWGGLDIFSDPYTMALNSEVRIIADSFWDIDVTQGERFTIVKDIVTT